MAPATFLSHSNYKKMTHDHFLELFVFILFIAVYVTAPKVYRMVCHRKFHNWAFFYLSAHLALFLFTLVNSLVYFCNPNIISEEYVELMVKLPWELVVFLWIIKFSYYTYRTIRLILEHRVSSRQGWVGLIISLGCDISMIWYFQEYLISLWQRVCRLF